MKFRVLVMLALISLFVLISLPAAMATSIPAKGDTMVLDSYNPSDMAGIMTFKVYPGGGTTYYYFSTFCIQDNVYITPGAQDYVAQVSSMVGYHDTMGPLDYKVDYLFSQFASEVYASLFKDGTLGISGQEYQADFQNLLWNLQGNGSSSYQPYNPYWYNSLITVTDNLAPNQHYGTMVLNLTLGENSTGIDVQNMLVDPPSVPEPASLVLLGSGLIALALAIRRRK